MSPEKEALFKKAQHRQSNMTRLDRLALADEAIYIRNWFNTRMLDAILNPPSGVIFTDELGAWLDRDDIRSYEADLFRRLAIGYSMLKDEWRGGEVLRIELDEPLLSLLESSLLMRRSVMDSDVRMVKDAFWMQDIKRSTLLKEITRIITKGDYVAAKRWIDEPKVSTLVC